MVDKKWHPHTHSTYTTHSAYFNCFRIRTSAQIKRGPKINGINELMPFAAVIAVKLISRYNSLTVPFSEIVCIYIWRILIASVRCLVVVLPFELQKHTFMKRCKKHGMPGRFTYTEFEPWNIRFKYTYLRFIELSRADARNVYNCHK